MRNGIFAVINIGTSAFRMEIGSFQNGKYMQLEYIIKSLSLGKDTFSKGFISQDSMEKAMNILQRFKIKMDEYNIKNRYKALATSSVREARNREFFIDYMSKKAGIKIEVLTPHEELYIRYISIKNEFKGFKKLENRGIALVNVSSGNVSIMTVKKKTILYADSLHFGSLRLNEIFNNIDERNKFYAYNRYISNMIETVKQTIKASNIKNVIFSGSSIVILNSILNPKSNSITKHSIINLFEIIKREDLHFIKGRFDIRENEAYILKPMLAIYTNILSLFNSDTFYFSTTTFTRKLIFYYSKSYRKGTLQDYLENTLIHVGEKYNFDKQHAISVKDNAIKIFDALKDIHLLDNRYRKILEIAAIMHDVGYFINANTHEKQSYYIIKSMNLPQITKKDNTMIALTALLHKDDDKYKHVARYEYLSEKDTFTLMKLASLIRIADAMDASHKQLIKEFSIVQETDGIRIKAKSNNFIYFEEVSFRKKSRLFEEIFGIKISLEHEIV